MKKSKKTNKRKKAVDRTWLGAKGIQTKVPQINNKPGVFMGKVFVKKSNMWVEYENYNTKGKTDKSAWSMSE